MSKKKRVSRPRRLLKRKAIKDRESRTQKPAERLNFTKRWISGLDHPSKGEPRQIFRDERTPHLCLRVTATAKTFYWEKTVRGSQKRVTIGRFPEINVEQARAQAADIAADYVKDKDVQAERRLKRREGTFGELWEDYREYRPRRKKGDPYSETLDDQWANELSQWKNKKLSELTHDIVYRAIMKKREKAPVYANRLQRHGQAMYNFARRNPKWRYRGDNPFDFDYESESGRERSVRLKPKDMPAFMAGVHACSESMRLLFLTSLYTGRRIGEVMAMRWDDLDLDSGVWRITVRKGDGERNQEAILPDETLKALHEREKLIDSEWVFPSNSKSGHVQEIKKAWATVREESGLRELQARDLRRTLASWAQDVSVPIAVVQSQLGHSSITTTAKHYTQIDPDIQRKALNATVASIVAASG